MPKRISLNETRSRDRANLKRDTGSGNVQRDRNAMEEIFGGLESGCIRFGKGELDVRIKEFMTEKVPQKLGAKILEGNIAMISLEV